MSMLTEKRNELEKKLDSLIGDRLARINDKVEAYREQLMSEEPLSEEILNTKKVLDALNEVIKYEVAEQPAIEEVPVVEPIVEPAVEVAAEPVVEAPVTEEVVIEPTIEPEPIVEPVINQVTVNAESIIPTTDDVVIIPAEATIIEAESRPGMPSIQIPERG